MTASILNGKLIASQLQTALARDIQTWQQAGRATPCLATIIINDSPASMIYVKNKRAACQVAGIRSVNYDLPLHTTEAHLLACIQTLNHQADVHGILVQLPLPAHINTQHVIEAIHPSKDVDGFHPYNLGRLAQRAPTLRPCTPFGIMQLLKAYEIPISGKHAVIVGASNIVGRPMALELLMNDATITICHRKTTHLETHIRQADLVVLATGNRHCVDIAWLHDKQIIIDVGIHHLENGMITGDIDFKAAQQKVAWITPVPGGVGPMTVTALLQNTFTAARHSSSDHSQ